VAPVKGVISAQTRPALSQTAFIEPIAGQALTRPILKMFALPLPQSGLIVRTFLALRPGDPSVKASTALIPVTTTLRNCGSGCSF
jgi:hypothetical protein